MPYQKASLAWFEVEYDKAVQKNKNKLMRKKFGTKFLKDLEKIARTNKIEISGGLDFEEGQSGITGYEQVKGTSMASPFFHEHDYEMQFHTHVAYRKDMNIASCHPSPADMGNVSLFYPGVILWEGPNGKVRWILLLSAHEEFVTSQSMEAAYNKARKNAAGNNTSQAFKKEWRATLNRAGLDFREIKPGETWAWFPRDTHPEKRKNKASISDEKFALILRNAIEKANAGNRYGGAVPFYAIWNDMQNQGIDWITFINAINVLEDKRFVDTSIINDIHVFSHPEYTYKLGDKYIGYVALRDEFDKAFPRTNKTEYEKINWVDIARDRWNNYIKQQLLAGQRMESGQKEYSEQVKQSFINAGYRIEGQFAIKGTEPETVLTDKQKENAIYKQLMREFMSSQESGRIYTSIKSFKNDIQDGTIKPYQIWHLPNYPRYAMMLQEKEWAKEERKENKTTIGIVEVFTTKDCHKCPTLIAFLDKHGIKHVKRMVDEDPDTETEALIYNIFSVPALKMGENVLCTKDIFMRADLNEDKVLAFLQGNKRSR